MKNINPGAAYIDQTKASALLEKWDPVLSYKSTTVAPIEDEHTRMNTAILLENQEQWCLKEATYAGSPGSVFGYGSTPATVGQQGGNVGNVDFYATGDARLPKVLIPMIRRTFPELITNEIVGVQPMSGPVGLAFALRYRYDGASLDWQDPSRRTYDATNPTEFRGGSQSSSDGREAGYNYLNSQYTGTSSAHLSGLGVVGSGEDWEQLQEDQGVAEWLANYEMTGQIPQMT
ncbi:unnamed protein product, partial [marine sediment metagenome]